MKMSSVLIQEFVLVAVMVLALCAILIIVSNNAERAHFNDMAPYIQNLSASSATVCFFTDAAETSYVCFSENMSFETMASDSANSTFHEIQLTGLYPNTTYNYYVRTTTSQSNVSSFRTAPLGTGAFRFAVYGDTRSNPYIHENVVGQMRSYGPEFIVNTGDEVSSGSSESDWAEFLNIVSRYSNGTCYWPSIGNHDLPADQGSNYRRFFSLPGNERWYSFDYANSHFVVLDTELPYENGTEQNYWLRNDLEAANNQSRWTFVVFHRPPYSNGGGHGSDLDVREELDYIFAENNVTAVFNSHDHIYEHAYPGNGVHYFVTGGGGAPLYSAGNSWFTIKSASVHHFLILDVTEEMVTITCITDDGTTIDIVEIMK